MPYVKRDENQEIISVSKIQTDEFSEYVEPHDEALRSFFITEEPKNIKQALSESDREVARVAEDLIHLLIQKNVIIFTELPSAVQKKILMREKLRTELNQEPSFLDDNESI
ncbi:hypothetical protein [Teredinibacter sp. KSP-S5-2]|uniref:hypothetical protein n=1 Tax=Teredinibacter sp. KSP-S5-2 TaxID=3034506 RepID=UPI00293517F6|nr:hypothetical protein [Teredinibacter sp. KSP-S5-2]WNO10363.1 hypothetical protein P5V12_04185 [Teredinibacter sp. KSP-S5-2]